MRPLPFATPRTANLKDFVKRADLIIAAIGKPLFVQADMVKEGAVIIGVGINRISDETKKSGYRLVGDADFEKVAQKLPTSRLFQESGSNDRSHAHVQYGESL